jgi:thymidylate kinase
VGCPKLIIFFGPDGSGKTTQSRLLASHFNQMGFKVRLVWIRAHHSLASILSKILASFGYYRIIIISKKESYKLFDVRSLPRLKRFWGFIEFISVLPWILIKVKLPLLLGYVVIADRYVVDTIVSVAHFFGDYEYLSGYAAKILLTMVSKDAFLIHLDAKTEVILERRKDEEIDVDFIRFQRKAYPLFAASLGALSIDTSNKDATDTFNVILGETNIP